MQVLRTISLILIAAVFFNIKAQAVEAKAAMKEWTFLVFINGHNNLSPFADMNITSMENVGSTDQLNVVVEWGSESTNITKRVFIKKTGSDHVSKSQVMMELPDHDMGDYKNLVSFIDWGVKNFPAKHYFIAVWNHGSGWHFMNQSLLKPMDISYDESSGHHITTEELGLAMAEAKKIIGHNVDIYGSDACLMQMMEVNGELVGSVDYVVGSQETEPGEGWPYEPFLAKWAKQPTMTPAQVSALLSREYKASYNGGVYGKKPNTTFSAVDLSKTADLYKSITMLGRSFMNLDLQQVKQLRSTVAQAVSFTYGDYVDLGDLLVKLKSSSFATKLSGLTETESALKNYVIAVDNNSAFTKAKGLSVWFPLFDSGDMQRYDNLKSSQETGWNNAIRSALKP